MNLEFAATKIMGRGRKKIPKQKNNWIF